MMPFDAKTTEAVLSWLPGYFWSKGTLRSTGAALPPTMHMDKDTGEIKVYVRPIFTHGSTVGLFLRLKGIEEAVSKGIFLTKQKRAVKPALAPPESLNDSSSF